MIPDPMSKIENTRLRHEKATCKVVLSEVHGGIVALMSHHFLLL